MPAACELTALRSAQLSMVDSEIHIALCWKYHMWNFIGLLFSLNIFTNTRNRIVECPIESVNISSLPAVVIGL